MKQSKKILGLAFLGTSLFAWMTVTAQADDDAWGGFPISVVVGAPAYAAPVYVPARPVAYNYYATPQGYYHRDDWRQHRDWRDHRPWRGHRDWRDHRDWGHRGDRGDR